MNQRPAIWAVIGLLVFGTIWEAFVRIGDIKPFALLEPSRILRALAEDPAFYLRTTWSTAWHTLIGVGIGLVVAVVVGAALAAVRRLEWAVQPILVLIMVTPWVAYITSVVLLLGAGTPTILFMVAFVTFPPFVFATVVGLRSADVSAREVFASIAASPVDVFWRLRLPSALPSLFTAARFSVGLGLAAAFFAEGGSASSVPGLGATAARTRGNQTLGAPLLWGSILCSTLLGIALLLALTMLERKMLKWHASQRFSIGEH